MKNKMLILILIGVVAGAILLAMILGKIKSRETIERPPTITAIQDAEGIPVRITNPQRREMMEVIILDGTVEPVMRAVLVSRINRKIEQITVDEGDRIEAGVTAVLLEKEALESALQAARTALDEERRNFQRAEALFAAGAVARQSLDQARVNRDQAEARYLQARETVEDSEIKSPLSGLVSRRHLEPGELSDTGKPILEIVDISTVEIHSPVNELEIGEIRVGQTALVFPDAYPDRSWESTVTTINPTTGETSRLFTIKIRIPNPEELLRPGMYCRVEIVKDVRPAALALPQETVVQDDRGGRGVYLFAAENSTARFQAVTTGISQNGLVEIVSGLSPNDPVIAAPDNRLADGTRVKLIPDEEER